MSISPNQTVEQLRAEFAVPGLTFQRGPGGLPRACIDTPLARALIYLHGAHVAAFQPAGHEPVLFTSAASLYQPGRPIRGGVPVIFPWFGPRAGHPESPIHGFVRQVSWTLTEARHQADGSLLLQMRLADDAQMRQQWPHAFELRYAVAVGRSLRLALTVVNGASEPFTFDSALHTYFAVGDVRQASVSGLAGATYLDKTDAMRRKVQDSRPITFTAETDRLYVNTTATCVLHDPVLGRRIVVEKKGSRSTVVWNPWIAKARAMPDFGDDEWPRMLCIETANAADNAVTLPPGRQHFMEVQIGVEGRP